MLKGATTAARAASYLHQGVVSPRAAAVIIDSRLCRGCADCAAVCPFIEMRERSSGTACAHIDRTLCMGCGACIAVCPTGAITQPHQSDSQLTSTLEALLGKVPCAIEAR
jgi:heterodisulfide reductase subunit A